MEKITDKSPVEQMREFLRMEVAHWHKDDTPMGVGRWRGAFNALSQFNELCPEVQQVPTLSPLEQIICDISTAEAEEHCNEPGFYKKKPEVAKRPAYIDQPSTPIQDIDVLAEKYTSEQIINDLEKRLYKCGLDNAKLIGKMTELKEQCLEDRGFSDEDMMNALNFAYGKGHSEGLLYDMPDLHNDKPSLVDWLANYKKED